MTESSNLLVALCLDGMKPHDSGTYSMTPMLLMPLGLPPHVSLPALHSVLPLLNVQLNAAVQYH